MRILAPVNKPGEVDEIIAAGADELYCGVMPGDWLKKYTNIASPNRREWTSANLSDFRELQQVVDRAHARGIPVYMTANAFYTEEQYPLMLDQIAGAGRIGVDAFIIGDVGLLVALKNAKLGVTIHISNTGAAFNTEAVRFFKQLGARRVILPRQLTLDEIAQLVGASGDIEFEVFIMNSGCKNIDGFCTFHHGVSEILYPGVWNFFKKLHFDHYLLEFVRGLPFGLSGRLKSNVFGIDSACLLNYKVSGSATGACRAISASFNLLSGADPCGACDLYRLKNIGIDSLKIVGRNHPTAKKIKDVAFLKKMLLCLEQDPALPEEDFKKKSRAEYVKTYGLDCKALCYRSAPSEVR